MVQRRLTYNEEQFLNHLNTNQVAYLVIGGYAVAYHGYQRAIGDLDVWVSTQKDNAQKLVAVVHLLGDGLPPEAASCFELPERVIRIGTPPFHIEQYQIEDRFIHIGAQPPQFEIMTSISGVEFAPCYETRVQGHIDGLPVSIISLPCLKANKKASIRPKDADDYAHLREG
jgi:hypothetical protein